MPINCIQSIILFIINYKRLDSVYLSMMDKLQNQLRSVILHRKITTDTNINNNNNNNNNNNTISFLLFLFS
jgi:hypothetical protein